MKRSVPGSHSDPARHRHATVLKYPTSARGAKLFARLNAAGEEPHVSIVTFEEQMRGWMASVAKERQAVRQVGPYQKLAELIDFYSRLTIVSFDQSAANRYDALPPLRIGASDNKIASIALATNSLLLTANRRDFEQVPGTNFDNWMD